MSISVETPLSRSVNWRGSVAGAVPALVATVGFYWLFRDQDPLSRIGYAVGSGVIFSAGVLMALFVATYFVSCVAGEPPRELKPGDHLLRGASLAVIVVWFLGNYWATTYERKMTSCLNERAAVVEYSGNRTALSEIVDYCRDRVDTPDSYYDDRDN